MAEVLAIYLPTGPCEGVFVQGLELLHCSRTFVSLVLGTKHGQDHQNGSNAHCLQSFNAIWERRDSIPTVVGSGPGFIYYFFELRNQLC